MNTIYKNQLCCKSCPTLCNPMNCSTPGFPVLHHLPEFAQIHIHWVCDAIQPFHPLSPSSPSALNLSQHQGRFQWVGSSHQVAEVLALQLQHPSFQWIFRIDFLSVQFSRSEVSNSCNPMDCSMPGFPVHHQLLELAQTHVHGVSDAIQPSHPLSSPSLPTFNLSQHQGLFWWVSSSHQEAKVSERQLQHQSFQWIFRTDFL